MIDELGMKGARRGGAVISPVHANFIVTEGKDATATDTLALAEEIRERVRRERGIELEYEVELWKGNTPAPNRASSEATNDEKPDEGFDNAAGKIKDKEKEI